jgi:hypothetical protein
MSITAPCITHKKSPLASGLYINFNDLFYDEDDADGGLNGASLYDACVPAVATAYLPTQMCPTF